MSRRPLSTYRLELTSAHGFAEGAALVSYLAELGATEVYTSPYLRSQSSSAHGYDVVRYTELHPSLGSTDDYAHFVAAVREHGMGHILDMVPNHMGIGSGENLWWCDVLEHGPASIYASTFDIDWCTRTPRLEGRVLLPILGAPFGEVLERGELGIAWNDGHLAVTYYERSFPVLAESLPLVLTPVAAKESLASTTREALTSLLSEVDELPRGIGLSWDEKLDRRTRVASLKERLATLVAGDDGLARALDDRLASLRGKAGDASSFDELERLLDMQAYRLAFWRLTDDEGNYRRFFDVDALAAIHMEEPAVFDEAHSLVLRLIDEGAITGLRIDHIDGLHSPAHYARRLQAACALRQGSTTGDPKRPFYILVEKILEPGERLPSSWDIHGTTGYDFLNEVNALWVDKTVEEHATTLYARFSGRERAFSEERYKAKRNLVVQSFFRDANALAVQLERLAKAHRHARDIPFRHWLALLVETMACFPVYRTYVDEDGRCEASDGGFIDEALAGARERLQSHPSPPADAAYGFLRDTLLMRPEGCPDPALRAEQARFVAKFQQTTGPVMAKGVEDTSFYVYYRLVCLNEVGGDPAHFGTTVAKFHEQQRERRECWPLSMLASSTHDTKRGEDVRTRIAALSEALPRFEQHLERVAPFVERHRTTLDGERYPIANDVYLFHQTVFGAFPLDARDRGEPFAERVAEYMAKATKEAKIVTAWTRPNEGYERAVDSFVRGMLRDGEYLAEVESLVKELAVFGVARSLGEVALRLTCPGVPDTYQGCELYNLSLVDPDNRRPVDFGVRRSRLAEIKAGSGAPKALAMRLLERFPDGAVKMLLVHRLLMLRRAHPDLFLDGTYEAVDAPEDVVAFARTHGDTGLFVAVPRLPRGRTRGASRFVRGDDFRDVRVVVPRGTWEHAVTGERFESDGALHLSSVFASFPVAVLVRAGVTG
jgi:(1->4)-alpha-D-glucan 1-alpha-D-glucosylmutase